MIDWKTEGNFSVKWPVNGSFVMYQFEISNRRTTGEEIFSKLQENVPPPWCFLVHRLSSWLPAPRCPAPSHFISDPNVNAVAACFLSFLILQLFGVFNIYLLIFQNKASRSLGKGCIFSSVLGWFSAPRQRIQRC